MVLIAVAVSSCGTPGAAGGKPSVVVAFYPVEFATTRVVGDLARVTNLTPPGAEPHDLELRPSDIVSLRRAATILYLADGFQPAVEKAIESLPDRSRAIDVLQGLPLRPPSGEGEAGLTVDPHVWLSPRLFKRIAAKIADVLAGRFPSRAADMRARGETLGADLDALDAEYRTGLKSCTRHEIFTSHAAFGYLAQDYGLTQVAITGLSPEAEPSPKRLQEVAALARSGRATTIFFETLVSPRVAAAVARIVGARTDVLDPIEGLTSQERARGEDYFSIMRQNLHAIQAALGCRT
jgi:zinc transport system substrate-binding protein